MTDILQWVHWLWTLGFWMAPADHPSLPECIGPQPCDGKRGKHPHGSWGRKATNNPKLLRSRGYFGGDLRNIIVACRQSRLLVVDEDIAGAFLAWATSRGHEIPPTMRVKTDRAWHWYFRAPEGVQLGNATGALKGHGIDVRGPDGGMYGGYVIGPGSTHQSGHVYTPADMDAPILPAPEWLVSALTPPPSALRVARRRATARSEHQGVAGLASWLSRQQEGGRNKALHWAACRAAEQHLPESAFEELVGVAVSIGLDESASRRTVASARRTAARRSA
jgi:hypothetical protein